MVFDTPPLAAGIDAYAVATAAQNLMLVLRIGQTDRRMASAKLELVDRLPVRVLGAVLNCVEPRRICVLQVRRGIWGGRRNEYGAASLSLVNRMSYFA